MLWRRREDVEAVEVEYPYGYFADPATLEPLKFQKVYLCHMEGRPLEGILGWIFFWVKVPQYELMRDVLYVSRPDADGKRRHILAKTGFIFNGGSVPFLFWWLYPPDQPDCLPAFVIHDWLCSPDQSGRYMLDSDVCHLYLHDGCLANGATEARANLIHRTVRLLGPRFKGEEMTCQGA